ncbi:WYL domain-containing protein [Jatrophihabitans telluris]|uniref:WYL domain-containing protein n=1 Tax=Jatrophihabitans telluris TaxID=2038343 RepID=A0ABY4QS16_9ACTN|nr:WYL domain-containing protein [Jatrophihabitans telluris]UQX86659.1 WYL domain-containing protein [Jatrophihabitans telluris]
MSDTGDKVTRLLALVPYVLNRGVASITETAEAFGISEDQVRKELEMLWLCGRSSGPEDLIDLMFEQDTVSVTYDGGLSRPLKLTATEAMTLGVALRTLTDLPGATSTGAAERALAKIETAAGQHLDTAGVDIRLAAQDRWLGLAQRAVAEKRAVELRYYTAARDESTHRVVDPVQVFTVDGVNYLEAWCRRAEGMRSFRLDRFEDATLLDEPAVIPVDINPKDVSEGVYRPAPEHLLVELSLGPGWSWVSEYYPSETVEPDPDEPAVLRVSLRVADPAWVAALVRRSGGAVSVLAPDWLARDVRAEAASALAAYSA